jgi:hypothetical protein
MNLNTYLLKTGHTVQGVVGIKTETIQRVRMLRIGRVGEHLPSNAYGIVTNTMNGERRSLREITIRAKTAVQTQSS